MTSAKAKQDEDVPFWRRKRLHEMDDREWESLCDGCGKCCLLKVEWADTGEVEPTSVACRLLDCESCQCSDYRNRFDRVPDCIDLHRADLGLLGWLPRTCAYRLVSEGRDLHWWHPLVSGDPETVHRAGISIRHKVISEDELADPDDLPRYVVDWKL